METIILTDNKRMASSYHADKILFTDSIDIKHILNIQVYQRHITKIKFWLIKTNIHNEEMLIHQFCNNLLTREKTSVLFTFSVTKIESITLSQTKDEKKNYKQKGNNWEKFRSSIMYKTMDYFENSSQSQKTLQLKKLTSYEKSLNPTNLSLQKSASCIIDNPPIDQFTIESQPKYKQQTTFQIKQIFKKNFHISKITELGKIFLTKQDIFQQQGIKDVEWFLNNDQTMSNYTFKQNEMEISVGVIGQGSKVFLQKAIEMEMEEAINQQFFSHKLIYESKDKFTHQVGQQSLSKLTDQKQTYHKILLFLFSHKQQSDKYIQGIQQWRIKDNEINSTQKLSKQYFLIKQEVQMEKINFRNKLKIFEAIIGESVNVDKLLLSQEMEIETYKNIVGNGHCNRKLGIPMDITRQASKSKRKSNLSVASNSNNSEFKRLKESFETIKNIDNVLIQQTKKIESLNKNLKEVTKQKHQAIYNHAKSINAVKKQILNIKQEIQLKERQYQYKKKKLLQTIEKKSETSSEAQQILNQNMKIFKKIIQNNKGIKFQQSLMNGSINKETFSEQKKLFLIKKHYKNNSNIKKSQEKSIQNDQQDPDESPTIIKSIYNSQVSIQQKMLKQRLQEVQYQQKQCINHQPTEKSSQNNKQKDLLMTLYQHFAKNQKLIQEINHEISSFQRISNDKMEITTKSNITRASSGYQFKRSTKNSIDSLTNSRGSSTSQLNLQKVSSPKSFFSKTTTVSKRFISSIPQLYMENFPILSQLLNPKIQITPDQDFDSTILSCQSFLEAETTHTKQSQKIHHHQNQQLSSKHSINKLEISNI